MSRGYNMEQASWDIRFRNTSPFVIKNFHRVDKVLNSKMGRKDKTDNISNLLQSIYQFDENISQNIIQCCDNLCFKMNKIDEAIMLLRTAMTVISGKNPQQALELVYYSNKHIVDDDILELALILHFENEDYGSVILLLDYFENSSKFSSIKETVDRRDKTQKTKPFIAEYRTKRLIGKIDKKEKSITLKVNNTSFFQTIMATPKTVVDNYRLILRLSKKDLDKKYRRSIIGWVWAILESLALTITFLFLFEIFSTTTSDYIALNIMIGIIAWSSFSSLVNQGTTSFVSNSGLIKKLQLPKEVFLLNLALTGMLTVGLNMIAIIPLVIYYEISFSVNFLIFPLVVLCIIFYGYSLTLLTSVTFAKWRDLGRIVNLVLRIGFYFTPVFFTLEMMIASRLPPEAVEIYLALNPMAILLTILRYTITGEGSNLSLNNIVLCFANILFTYILASVWFNKKKDKGAKYL